MAVTRTKNKILIPESLLPEDFQLSSHIQILKTDSYNSIPEKNEKKQSAKNALTPAPKPKMKLIRTEIYYSENESNENHFASNRPWTRTLEEELANMYYAGINEEDLAEHFGRSQKAIRRRLRRLGLGDIE